MHICSAKGGFRVNQDTLKVGIHKFCGGYLSCVITTRANHL